MSASANRELRLEKHRRIAELVPNKTFADVGGLWGTLNETVSIAMQHGAREATMVDIQRSDTKWWKAFDDRCRDLGVSGYRSVVGDICNDRIVDQVGPFDITHCAGIIYHVPNPVGMIHNLISITRERFILGSMVVPKRIVNQFGTLELSMGQCLLVPVLSERERNIVAEHFSQMKVNALGVTQPASFMAKNGPFRYAPYWWLYTEETLVGMCRMFDVTVENIWVDWARPGTGTTFRSDQVLSVSVSARINPMGG